MNKKRKTIRISIIILVLIIIGLIFGNKAVYADIIGDAADGVAGLFLLIPKFFLIAVGEVIRILLGFFTGKGLKGVTVQDILFNKLDITDINFFDFNIADDSIKAIRENVAGWYLGVRNLSAVLLVIVALYVGIRMALSTIAEDRAKYKQMLIDWITSVCLLFILHFIMVLIIEVNNTIVETIANNVKNQNLLEVTNDFRSYALGDFSAINVLTLGLANGAENGFASTFAAAVIYLMLQAITLVFLLSYIKRMITIGFLIIIAPLVTVTYSIDKMGDGRSQALNHWLKEFTYNILIQPFQCVTYLALCSTSLETLQSSKDFKSAVIAISMLIFLVSSEKIIKHIFHFQSESMADTVAAAGMTYAAFRTLGSAGRKMFGDDGGGSSDKVKIPKAGDNGPALPPDTNSGGNSTGISEGRDEGSSSADTRTSRTGNSDSGNSNSGNSDSERGETASRPNTGMTPDSNTGGTRRQRAGSTARKVGSKAADVLIKGNAAALGLGLGLAFGGASGDLKQTILGAAAGAGAFLGYGGKTSGRLTSSHYKKEVARAFNDYRAQREAMGENISDDEIGELGMEFLMGSRQAVTAEERALRDALINMQNNYIKSGEDEKKSLKSVRKVIQGIKDGEITEQMAATRYVGSLRDRWESFMNRTASDNRARTSSAGRRGNSGGNGYSNGRGNTGNGGQGGQPTTPQIPINPNIPDASNADGTAPSSSDSGSHEPDTRSSGGNRGGSQTPPQQDGGADNGGTQTPASMPIPQADPDVERDSQDGASTDHGSQSDDGGNDRGNGEAGDGNQPPVDNE